jgi:hypothetical protein
MGYPSHSASSSLYHLSLRMGGDSERVYRRMEEYWCVLSTSLAIIAPSPMFSCGRIHPGVSRKHESVGFQYQRFAHSCSNYISLSRGYVQGGSDGMPILGDFAVKYGAQASKLGVPTDDLYQALVDTADNTVCTLPLIKLSTLIILLSSL